MAVANGGKGCGPTFGVSSGLRLVGIFLYHRKRPARFFFFSHRKQDSWIHVPEVSHCLAFDSTNTASVGYVFLFPPSSVRRFVAALQKEGPRFLILSVRALHTQFTLLSEPHCKEAVLPAKALVLGQHTLIMVWQLCVMD